MTTTTRDNTSLGCAGLAVGTTAGTFKTGNAIPYQLAGLSYQKAATDNIALAAIAGTAFASLAASRVACFFVLINAAGTVTIRESAVQLGSTAAGYVPGAFEWPGEENGQAVIGAFKIETNASGAFVPATTSLAAANQTVTYFNAGMDYGVPIAY